MLNIVVPMAGAGSRFAKKGYEKPKPLIEIDGVPMIRLVIDNLKPKIAHRFIFVCQNEHINKYSLKECLMQWAPGSIVLGLDGLTEGAACTVLTAKKYINNEDGLMIANSDQYIDSSIDEYLGAMKAKSLDGIIMTMKAEDPKWSFVGLNSNGEVLTVVEKEAISNEATVGIYNFKYGRNFVSAAQEMIDLNLRVNNEFYVAPVYNQLIKNGLRFGYFNIGEEANGMYGLGIPDDLELFIEHPICKKAIKRTA
jgi:dTDP-glucose pyrophosphorylase